MPYRPRVVDVELADKLSATGAVLIEGPKACGKTETAMQRAASIERLDLNPNAAAAVDVDPSLVLEGPVPRLIDEWQIAPAIWNHVRREIDRRKVPGQFILTGSAVPADGATRHTGALRIARMQMRPMTLLETGHSSGEISLRALLDGASARARDPGLGVREIANRIGIGGWPGIQDLSVKAALTAVRSYLDEIRRVDVGRVDGTRRDPERVLRLMRSIARNVSSPAAITTLTDDTNGPDGTMSRDTVTEYLDVLTRLKVVEEQPAWQPHMRSRYQLRKAARRHFVDPSLAMAALRRAPRDLLGDLGAMGLFFESLVIRDLRVFAQALDGEVLHYRDNDGLEVDAVVETVGGPWGAFEIKLGQGQVDHAASSLLKFAKRVDTDVLGEPAVLGVITATGYGYVRPDGVAVIPVGALGP
jgi:uncharacterized protein